MPRTLRQRAIHTAIGAIFRCDQMLEHLPFGTIIGCHTPEPLIALTFDDGPHPEYTPQLLRILDRHSAKATFFLVGKHAQQHPELLQQMAQAGHAMANHTHDHVAMARVPRAEQIHQLAACESAIQPHNRHRLFRPPWGVQDLRVLQLLSRNGYHSITWGADIDDWNHHSPEWFSQQIQQHARPGLILLMHDQITPPADECAFNRSNMLAGLDAALEQLAPRYQFITVPDLLRRGAARTRRICSDRLSRLYANTAP